ncbi:hypothetical protein [Tengunoibacter tsumagoiensis]|uniref:HTH cro/C1-type domain-containing protein n=1 Tax=Tengunoibacter tsumagoiensis TaxID=2014871 RepID=A0A402A7G5_9CHLR|nr:hypothetical protein [Tengunoibacter tsumagoiensis]GCE15097.1 hypothetical protein KTT_49560 [Tengunoibacter tsumagoiensis]
MSTFWGEGGQYGPYTLQKDGWPNAGQVMRDFRQQMGISAEEAARLYSTALEIQGDDEKGKKSKGITASWIFSMENENRVPTHIHRRRILADILQIPYALFGLLPLSQVAFKVPHEPSLKRSPLIERVLEDPQRYDKELDLFWKLHYTNTAGTLLCDIDRAILTLEPARKASKGSLQQHIQSLLNGYYQLGAEVTRSQGKFQQSLAYANNAVHIVHATQGTTEVAQAFYTRGYTHLVSGLFGEKNQTGSFQINPQRIGLAISDFEQALPSAPSSLKGRLLMELSRSYVHLKRSSSDLAIALDLAKRAKETIGSDHIISHHTPIHSLNEGMFLLGHAITLTGVGRPEKALEELDQLSSLKGIRGIARNQLRRQAWIDIVSAHAAMSAKNYYDVIMKLLNAFEICRELNLTVNINIIHSIYCQLLLTSYKKDPDVLYLKTMLRSYYQARKEVLT